MGKKEQNPDSNPQPTVLEPKNPWPQVPRPTGKRTVYDGVQLTFQPIGSNDFERPDIHILETDIVGKKPVKGSEEQIAHIKRRREHGL